MGNRLFYLDGYFTKKYWIVPEEQDDYQKNTEIASRIVGLLSRGFAQRAATIRKDNTLPRNFSGFALRYFGTAGSASGCDGRPAWFFGGIQWRCDYWWGAVCSATIKLFTGSGWPESNSGTFHFDRFSKFCIVGRSGAIIGRTLWYFDASSSGLCGTATIPKTACWFVEHFMARWFPPDPWSPNSGKSLAQWLHHDLRGAWCPASYSNHGFTQFQKFY